MKSWFFDDFLPGFFLFFVMLLAVSPLLAFLMSNAIYCEINSDKCKIEHGKIVEMNGKRD